MFWFRGRDLGWRFVGWEKVVELLPCQFTMQHSPQLMESLFQGFVLHQQRIFFPPSSRNKHKKAASFVQTCLTVGKRDDEMHMTKVWQLHFHCLVPHLFCEGVSESGRRLQQQQQNMDLELKKHSRAQLNWINSLTLFETRNMKM